MSLRQLPPLISAAKHGASLTTYQVPTGLSCSANFAQQSQNVFCSWNNVATLGVLTLSFNERCSISMSSLRGIVGNFDPYSTRVRSSYPVFKLGSLARNGVPEDLSSEGPVLPSYWARFLSYVHFAWQAWHYLESGHFEVWNVMFRDIQILTRCPFTEILPRDLIKRSCTETSHIAICRDLAKRPLTEILPIEPLDRSCTEILPWDLFRDLEKGPCTNSLTQSYTGILHSSFYTQNLSRRSCAGSSTEIFAKGTCRILPGISSSRNYLDWTPCFQY